MKDRIELFALCFGDSEESVREFFAIDDVITLTEYESCELVAMASLVPLTTEGGMRGFYAYGVCVHPNHRGKGAFRRIMSSCEAYAKECEADFVCLIPADERLAESYRRMGYDKKIELCHNADKDSERILVSSKGFLEYAMPDGYERGAIPYGLMKPLGEHHKQQMAFFSPMGDC